MDEHLLLTVNEVAKLTGFATGTLYHFVIERRIPFVRISARCIRFDRKAIDAWIAQMAVPVDTAGRPTREKTKR